MPVEQTMPHRSPQPVCEVLIRELISRRNMHLCEALRYVGRADAAEDILQNTALKCLTCPPQTQPDNPGFYVSRMVRNASIDYLRKHAREVPTAFDTDAQLERAGVTPLCGCERLQRKQALDCVARALGAVPRREREVFLRHRLSQVQQKEIAAELDLSRALINGMIKQVQAACTAALEPGPNG